MTPTLDQFRSRSQIRDHVQGWNETDESNVFGIGADGSESVGRIGVAY